MNRLRILSALLRKEVIMMRNNPFIPRLILIMPLMVMLVVPLVATLDVRNVNVAVVDLDASQLSRRMIADINAADALTVTSLPPTYDRALSLMEHGKADVILTIPAHFSRDLGSLEIRADGVNATKGSLGAQYVGRSVMMTVKSWLSAQGIPEKAETVSVIDRFNPTLDFRIYMIPALMIMLLIIICGFLPTLSLVGEKESGTIEAINVTPVGRFTFMLSKLIPYWVAGLVVVTIGMVVAGLVYNLWPSGGFLEVYLAAVLFSLLMSGLGVTVANSSSTMMQSIFVMFAIIIVFQLMGGLFTPISSMPEWAQVITIFVPPRYFNEIMRSVYLKGATIGDLWQQYSALAAFALATCLLAAATYRKRS